jgi:NmrA-like family
MPRHWIQELSTLLQADLNNASTLKGAMKDAYAVFAVTNYWESRSAEVEMTQGKAMADAAKVRVFVSQY